MIHVLFYGALAIGVFGGIKLAHWLIDRQIERDRSDRSDVDVDGR